MSLRLIGYRFSVYSRAARMALVEAGRHADWHEADPFCAEGQAALRDQHPFGRVPVLWDGDFRLYETGAILCYLLAPDPDQKRRARARQVAGIVDNYAYWPLVRQVYAHGVLRPLAGLEPDAAALAEGLAGAPRVLDALEDIAAEGRVLNGADIGAADCHLAPMIGGFAQYPPGRDMLATRPALAGWFHHMARRDSYRRSEPDLSQLEAAR